MFPPRFPHEGYQHMIPKYANEWTSPSPPPTKIENFKFLLSDSGILSIQTILLLITVYSILVIIWLICSMYCGKNREQQNETSKHNDKILKEIIIHEDEPEDLSITVNPKTKLLTTLHRI